MMRQETTAPTVRTVEQHTGITAADWLSIAQAAAAIDKLRQERDDARAELDNMMTTKAALGRLVADLTSEAGHWQADRDEERERAEEWRSLYDAARDERDELQTRLDEVAP